MPDLTYKLKASEKVEDTVIVALNGSLLKATLRSFKSLVGQLEEDEKRHVILDMARLKELDTSGQEALVDWHRRLQLGAGLVVVFALNDSVKRTFEMIGLSHIIEVAADLERAEGVVAKYIKRRRDEVGDDGSGLAVDVSCPGCGARFVVSQIGPGRCLGCGEMFNVDVSGEVFSLVPRGGEGKKKLGLKGSLEINSELSLVDVAASFAAQFCRGGGFGEDQAGRIRKAVQRAVRSIVKHSYDFNPGGVIKLSVEIDAGEARFTLVDRGTAHNPDRPSSSGTRALSELMDEVRYKSLPKVSNTLTMTLRRVEPDEEEAEQEEGRAAAEREEESEPAADAKQDDKTGGTKRLSREELLERARRARAKR